MRIILIICFISLLIAPGFAFSEILGLETKTAGNEENRQIEITADESLEWHKDKNLYIARGKAKVSRGELVVEADTLAAHQRENKTESKDPDLPSGNIDRITAEGNVSISNGKQKVFGDLAVYDLDEGIIKLTGKNLKYIADNNMVTAKDSLEYHEKTNTAIARGKAVAVQEKRRVEANVLKARFSQNAEGQTEIVEMSAEGNVTIATENDISQGDKAVYDMKNNLAVMTGNVRVTRDNLQLSGDRAEVDFAKGESRIANKGKGRVRALLLPKEKTTAIDSERKMLQKAVPEKKGR